MIRKMERSFKRQVFIVDNCPAHPKTITGLRYITFFYLPPSTKSVLQPMDGGSLTVSKVMIGSGLHEKGSWRMRQKRIFFRFARCPIFHQGRWNTVTKETIDNSFSHCGFVDQEDVDILETREEAFDDIWNRLRTANLVPDVAIDDYTSLDTNLVTSCNLDEFIVIFRPHK